MSNSFERKLLKKDNTIVWTHISGAPMINESGEFNGSFAMVTDITERKKAENEILKLNRLYLTVSECNESLIQASDEIELLFRISNIIVNKGGYKLVWVGYAQQDKEKSVKPIAYAGEGVNYLQNIKISWGDNELGRGPTGTSIRTGKVQILNYYTNSRFKVWKEEANKQGFLSSAAFPLTINGKTFGTLNIYSKTEERFDDDESSLLQELASDLSYGIANLRTRNEIQKLNQNLEHRVAERTAQLEVLNKSLEAFSYSVSHDLHSPLNRINGYLNVLEEKTKLKLNDQEKLYLSKIAESTNNMNQLIEDILSFSTMGQKELKTTTIDLSDILKDVINDFELDIKDRNIKWNIDKLPIVKGDKNLLRIVFVNLISNALKYTRNLRETKIAIGKKLEENENIIFIRDNGVGFEEKNSSKIFRPFQRLHSDSLFEGSGIGLAIVQRIISSHGGRIWAEGEEGKGAVFYFSLPITEY